MGKKVHVNQQLLQAIIRDPENIESRLVYADWLEEQSDPQSSLIRVQCEIATGDPRSASMIDLDYQQRSLLMKHRSSWTKPARGYASKLDFRLGLVGWAGTTAENFLQYGESLYNVAPIMEVRMTHPQKVVAELCECSTLAKVHTLNIRDGGLGLARLRELLKSPHLKSLRGIDLGYNGLKASSMKLLAEHGDAWPRLRELKLESCGVTREELQRLLESGLMDGLETLSLGNNDLDDDCLELLARASCLQSLKTLELQFNRRMGERGLQALWSSPHLRQVQELSFYKANLSPTAVQTFSKCKWPLTSLDLTANAVAGAEKALGKSPAVRGLTELVLSDCGLTDEGFSQLLGAAKWKHLRSLDLSYNKNISGKTVETLANWPGCKRLTTLILTMARPGEEGLKVIADNTCFRNLHELRVCDNTDNGVLALADAEHLENILLIEVGAKSGKKERLSKKAQKSLVSRFGSKACKYTYWYR